MPPLGPLLAAVPEVWIPTLALSSIVYLALLFFSLRLARSADTRLLLAGLLTGLLAVWCSQLSHYEGGGLHLKTPPAGEVVVGGEAAAILGRLAVLLVLGGLAVAVLGRPASTPTSPGREEGNRVHPS
jgi:hypothetical protein